ncbi:MAG: hypothetical protein JSV70_04795 [bacterium]|nr:MAG: hypothetical protein JSV70_04795 [bacterium]
MNRTRLTFQLTRRDLYDIFRITAAQRPFRRVAMPGLALFVFLGHALDGNYDKGIVWAVIVGGLYWGVSQIMYLLHVYGAANESLLSPQQIVLSDELMAVTSEYSREEFLKPDPSDVHVAQEYLVIATSTGRLVFLKRSFHDPQDYEELKNWLVSGPSGHGDTETR